MGARFRSWGQKRRKSLLVTGIIVLLVVAGVLIWASYAYKWSGAGFVHKTVWDWLQLLVIPFALAIIAVLFNRAERKNEQRVASDNQQEAALQGYLNEISKLMLEKDLRKSDVDAEVRIIARVRTLAVLPRLDSERKRSVLQFLHESGLIGKGMSIIDLDGADLRNANLLAAILNFANLSKARLNGANLIGALLLGADLSRANLTRADLRRAELSNANLSDANLRGADLRGAYLSGANLRGANLSDTDLSFATLVLADLGLANLSNANLRNTFLKGAIVTPEQLDATKTLQDAIMPDESIHTKESMG